MSFLTPSSVFAPGRKPPKAEIIQLLEAIMAGGVYSVVKATRAELLAVVPAAITDIAPLGYVLDDPTDAYNGIYAWTGTWTRRRGFPDTFARLTQTGGTNAVVATTSAGVDPAVVQVFFIEPTATNSGNVTMAVDGAAAKPVRNVNGDELAAGEWPSGRKIMLVEDATEYRLLSDPDVDGLAAAAAASAASAEADRILAEQAAIDAQAAVTFSRVVVRGTTTGAGPYDMGVGNTIGTPNNLDVKLGGVIQDHNTYTVAGTEFTFTVDPGAGIAYEAVLTSETRVLNAPAAGSVTDETLDPVLLARFNRIVTAQDFGAVFDDSVGDRAKIKAAALYAIANNLPFVVPNRGGVAGVGIEIQYPEDVSNLQTLINAVATWIFPRNRPSQDAPYAAPYLVTISVADTETVTSGKGFVWPFGKGGAGDMILLKGRGRTSMSMTSLVSQTAFGGLVFVTLGFASLPTGIAEDDYLVIPLTGGTNNHEAIRGCWQISGISGNQVTFRVYYAGASAITGMTLTSASIYYLPAILRFTHMPFDGADRAGIDVQENCHLNIQDIVLSGVAGGTNAVSTQGIMVRKGASVNFEQFVGVHGFQRAGVWLVENGSARLSFGYISLCDTGVNLLSGSVAIFDYGVSNGNISNNVVVGLGSTMSAAPITSMGTPGTCVYVLNGGSFITSLAGGYTRIGKAAYGVVAESGGIAHLNDAPVVDCTVGMSARAGSTIVHNGGTSGNGDDYKPNIDTASNGAIIISAPATDL